MGPFVDPATNTLRIMMWAIVEMTSECSMPQGVFQQLVSCDRYRAACKGINSVEVEVTAHGFVAGNVMPSGWQDRKGSLMRRMAGMLMFTNSVSKPDPMLQRQLMEGPEYSAYIVKGARSYFNLCMRAHGKPLGPTLHPLFHMCAQQVSNTMKPKTRYITSGAVEIAPRYWDRRQRATYTIKMDIFLKQYKNWCRRHAVRDPGTDDNAQLVSELRHLGLWRAQRVGEGGESGWYLFGCKLNEETDSAGDVIRTELAGRSSLKRFLTDNRDWCCLRTPPEGQTAAQVAAEDMDLVEKSRAAVAGHVSALAGLEDRLVQHYPQHASVRVTLPLVQAADSVTQADVTTRQHSTDRCMRAVTRNAERVRAAHEHHMWVVRSVETCRRLGEIRQGLHEARETAHQASQLAAQERATATEQTLEREQAGLIETVAELRGLVDRRAAQDGCPPALTRLSLVLHRALADPGAVPADLQEVLTATSTGVRAAELATSNAMAEYQQHVRAQVPSGGGTPEHEGAQDVYRLRQEISDVKRELEIARGKLSAHEWRVIPILEEQLEAARDAYRQEGGNPDRPASTARFGDVARNLIMCQVRFNSATAHHTEESTLLQTYAKFCETWYLQQTDLQSPDAALELTDAGIFITGTDARDYHGMVVHVPAYARPQELPEDPVYGRSLDDEEEGEEEEQEYEEQDAYEEDTLESDAD